MNAEQADGQKERERLIAKISELEKSACDDPSKPCKRLLSSSDQPTLAKEYQDEVFAKINSVGERIYSESIAADGRYDFVIVMFELNLDGGLEDFTFLKSSEVKEMNEFAAKVIKMAAPYPKIEGLFNNKTDIVVLTNQFQFNVHNRNMGIEKSD